MDKNDVQWFADSYQERLVGILLKCIRMQDHVMVKQDSSDIFTVSVANFWNDMKLSHPYTISRTLQMKITKDYIKSMDDLEWELDELEKHLREIEAKRLLQESALSKLTKEEREALGL